MVPAPAIQAALGAAAGKPELDETTRPAVSVCIVWDTSSSAMEPIEKKPATAGAKKPAAEEEAAMATRDPKLQLLLDQVIAAYAKQDTELTLSVFTLNVELQELCSGPPSAVREAVRQHLPLQYDGGTDLSLLGGESGLLNEAGPLGKGCDEGAIPLTPSSRPP